MTHFEYRRIDATHMRDLNEAGREGFRVVPGIWDRGYVLMERIAYKPVEK